MRRRWLRKKKTSLKNTRSQQRQQQSSNQKSFVQLQGLLNRSDRDVSFELGHDVKNLGIDGPVVQVGNGAFKERGHSCVSGLNVPVVACVVGMRPCDTNLADEMADREFLGVLV
jgi:hypothetical protein